MKPPNREKEAILIHAVMRSEFDKELLRSAASALAVGREEIARIIDPHSFLDIQFTDDASLLDMVEQSKTDALRKADTILSLLFQSSAYKAGDGNRPLPFDRDQLGRFVREAWVRWAEQQEAPKPNWLLPYDELSESDKEVDRQIGEAVARWTLIGDAARYAFRDDFKAGERAGAEAMRDRCAETAYNYALPAGQSDDYGSGFIDSNNFIGEAISALPLPTLSETKTDGGEA